MMPIRNSRQVAVHKLLSSLIDSRNYYESVSTLPELSTFQYAFSSIVSDRSAQIDSLRKLIRLEGDLPSEGNDELSAALGLGTKVEAAISDDPLKSALERCIATEEVLGANAKDCIEVFSESGACNEIRTIDRQIEQTLEFLRKRLGQ